MEALKQQLESLAAAKTREAERINLKRRADQEKLGPEIVRYERRAADQQATRLKLEREIAALEAQCATLKGE